MVNETNTINLAVKLLFGFIAGYAATILFHQHILALLWGTGFASSKPFSMEATHPLGLPAVISLSFWGGIWGIIYVMIDGMFPSNAAGYWITAFLFGAILPSLVALLVVFPLKGRPLGGGWDAKLLATVFVINGAWGIGTGLIFKILKGWFCK